MFNMQINWKNNSGIFCRDFNNEIYLKPEVNIFICINPV